VASLHGVAPPKGLGCRDIHPEMTTTAFLPEQGCFQQELGYHQALA
jgi:hypothetical protein